MKSALIFSMLVLTCSAKQLLGGDDVDLKQAELQGEENDIDKPMSISEVKQKLREDKLEIKGLHSRVSTLKEQLQDNKKSKTDKKTLMNEFKEAKSAMKAKKQEVNELKKEISDLKNEKKQAKIEAKKDKENKRGGKKHHLTLIGEEEQKINQQGSEVKPSASISSAQGQKDKKTHKKHKGGFGNKNKDDEDDETTTVSKTSKKVDRPRLRSADSTMPLRRRLNKDTKTGRMAVGRGGHNRNGHRKCSTDDQCGDGERCVEIRNGKKKCKAMPVARRLGEKCHSVKQCAEGLKCFVANPSSDTVTRKQKGVCVDPTTADLKAGSFLGL